MEVPPASPASSHSQAAGLGVNRYRRRVSRSADGTLHLLATAACAPPRTCLDVGLDVHAFTSFLVAFDPSSGSTTSFSVSFPSSRNPLGVHGPGQNGSAKLPSSKQSAA